MNASRRLIGDLWWFIENVDDTAPDRSERFFDLRERVRRETWGRSRTLPCGCTTAGEACEVHAAKSGG